MLVDDEVVASSVDFLEEKGADLLLENLVDRILHDLEIAKIDGGDGAAAAVAVRVGGKNRIGGSERRR